MLKPELAEAIRVGYERRDRANMAGPAGWCEVALPRRDGIDLGKPNLI